MSALEESLQAAQYGQRHDFCWATTHSGCGIVAQEPYVELGLCTNHGIEIAGAR